MSSTDQTQKSQLCGAEYLCVQTGRIVDVEARARICDMFINANYDDLVLLRDASMIEWEYVRSLNAVEIYFSDDKREDVVDYLRRMLTRGMNSLAWPMFDHSKITFNEHIMPSIKRHDETVRKVFWSRSDIPDDGRLSHDTFEHIRRSNYLQSVRLFVLSKNYE